MYEMLIVLAVLVLAVTLFVTEKLRVVWSLIGDGHSAAERDNHARAGPRGL